MCPKSRNAILIFVVPRVEDQAVRITNYVHAIFMTQSTDHNLAQVFYVTSVLPGQGSSCHGKAPQRQFRCCLDRLNFKVEGNQRKDEAPVGSSQRKNCGPDVAELTFKSCNGGPPPYLEETIGNLLRSKCGRSGCANNKLCPCDIHGPRKHGSQLRTGFLHYCSSTCGHSTAVCIGTYTRKLGGTPLT